MFCTSEGCNTDSTNKYSILNSLSVLGDENALWVLYTTNALVLSFMHVIQITNSILRSPCEANVPSFCCSRVFFTFVCASAKWIMSTPCHYILFIYLCTELNAAIYIKGVWDSVVGMAAGRPGDRIPLGGGEIFLTSPDRTWGPPSLLYNDWWVFSGGIVDVTWCWLPTPF